MNETLQYDYLRAGLLEGNKMREDLLVHARDTARIWLERKIDPSVIEILAENLARMARHLPAQEGIVMGAKACVEGLSWIGNPQEVSDFIRMGVGEGATRVELMALAVHVLDVAESMALEMYAQELPALTAKSERSAESARSVGAALFLRG